MVGVEKDKSDGFCVVPMLMIENDYAMVLIKVLITADKTSKTYSVDLYFSRKVIRRTLSRSICKHAGGICRPKLVPCCEQAPDDCWEICGIYTRHGPRTTGLAKPCPERWWTYCLPKTDQAALHWWSVQLSNFPTICWRVTVCYFENYWNSNSIILQCHINKAWLASITIILVVCHHQGWKWFL